MRSAQLAAICVILATCGMLIVMVVAAMVKDWRRQRGQVNIGERLEPYGSRPVDPLWVVDVREPRTGAERYLAGRLDDPEYAEAYKDAARD